MSVSDPRGSELAIVSARNAELATLNRVAEAAGAAPDLETFLAQAGEEVASLLDAAMVGFFLVQAEKGVALLLHLHGGTEDERRRLAFAPIEGTLFDPAGPEVVARVRDVADLPAPMQELLAPLGLATVASTAARFRSKLVGVLSVGYRERRAAAACRLDLLEALGAHFASAVVTHRLLGDLRGRVEELTLLNDVAVATATLDPTLLLENALRRTSATFRADTAGAYLLDGSELRQTACLGVAAETAARTARLPLGTGPAGRAVAERKTIHFPELAPVNERQAWIVERERLRVGVGVPLLAKDRVLGAFVLGRRRPEPFTDAELSLLTAVGVQLGVAVENARLFADTRRRVADLEAVNAVAQRVFATAPGDARLLLEEASRELARALGVRAVVVLQLDPGREQLAGVAGFGTPLPPAEIAIPLARSDLVRHTLATGEPSWGLHVLDTAAGEHGPPPLSVLLVPLSARGATRGVVALADGPERRYSEAEIALAVALAGEAAVGLENAELYAEARHRVEELSLVHEVGRSLVATLELDQVLDAGVRNLARIVDAPDAYLLLADPRRDRMVMRAAAGGRARLVGFTLSLHQPSLANFVYAQRAPVTVEDASADARVAPELQRLTGARAYLGLPLAVRDRAIGVALISETRGPRRFAAAEVERAAAIANQLAVAVENARLYEDLRRSYADLARAQDQLVRQERLAALGELAAVVAHEVRNPLAVVFNSLGSLRRLVPASGDGRMLLDIVAEEAERLNRMVGDLLDFARPPRPTVRPEPLAAVVEEALAAALVDGGRGVRIERELPDDLPPVPMDARLLRQAVVNLLLNASQAMGSAGTLTVRARVEGGSAVLEIEDTGPGIPEDVRHRIFEPFFTTKATGSGLGLAVVKRIVDDHRGTVQTRPGSRGGAVFAIRLPLRRPAPLNPEAASAEDEP